MLTPHAAALSPCMFQRSSQPKACNDTGASRRYGTYFYKNGSIYDGEFLEDEAHGLGTFKGVNGEFYQGEWQVTHAPLVHAPYFSSAVSDLLE